MTLAHHVKTTARQLTRGDLEEIARRLEPIRRPRPTRKDAK